MNGEAQRIPAVKDKPGELTISYVAHGDGVSNSLSVLEIDPQRFPLA